MHKLPGIGVRPATASDQAAIMAVMNAHSQAVLGTQRALIDHHGALRFARYMPPHAERIVAETGDGQVVGFLALVNKPPHISTEASGAVHPAYCNQGVGSTLLGWADQQAQAFLPLAPAEAQVVLQCHSFTTDERSIALLRRAGYMPRREWLHFEIMLDAAPPAPHWPPGISVRQMDQARDWPLVGAALEDAFADHWGELRRGALPTEAEAEEDTADDETEAEDDQDDLYSNSRDFCFVISDGAAVVGACLGNARTVEWPESGKIGSISIRRAYRKQGIGQAIMQHALGTFYQHGITRVILDTDSENFTGSYRLYERVGMRVFRREHLYEKVVRAGTELRVMSAADLA